MTEDRQTPRPFGLPSATALVVANMIGAGVFTTSGFALADLGSREWVLLAWLVAGTIAMAGAASYGLLSARIQESGGEYVFLSRAIHPAVGFVAGWVSLLAGFTGAIAFAASAFETYALPAAVRPDWVPEGALAIGAILLLAALHGLKLRAGLRFQNAIVVAKLLALAAFVLYAFTKLESTGWTRSSEPDPQRPFSPYAFANSLVWISLSYSGFNAAVYVLAEVREPRQTVPRAMLFGTLFTTLIYIALNGIFLYAPDSQDLVGKADVAVIAAQALGGQWLLTATRVVIALALLTSVSSMVIAGPRVYDRMARDGVFPSWLGVRQNQTENVPTTSQTPAAPRSSIALQAVLASIVVAVTTLEELLAYLGFTLSLCAAATVASLFVLRSREENGLSQGLPRGALVAPALYTTCTLGLAILAGINRPWQLLAALVTIASGLALYTLTQSNRPTTPAE